MWQPLKIILQNSWGVVFKAINVEYGIEKVIFEGNKQITFFDRNTGSTYRCLYSNIHFRNNTYQMLEKYSLNSKSKKCLYDILEDNVLYRFDFSNGILYLIKNPTLKHYYMQDYSHKNVEWYLGRGYEMEDGREYYMYFLER